MRWKGGAAAAGVRRTATWAAGAPPAAKAQQYASALAPVLGLKGPGRGAAKVPNMDGGGGGGLLGRLGGFGRCRGGGHDRGLRAHPLVARQAGDGGGRGKKREGWWGQRQEWKVR